MPLPAPASPSLLPPLLLSAPTRSLNSPPILLPPSAPSSGRIRRRRLRLAPHLPLPSFPPIIPDSFFLFFLLSLVCLLRVPHFSPTGRRPLIISISISISISRQCRRRSGLLPRLPPPLLRHSVGDLHLRPPRPPPDPDRRRLPLGGALKSVALLPDGRRALTAHQDGRVRVWRRSGRSGRLRLAAALPTVPDRVRRLPLPGSYVRVRRHRRRLWIEHADAVSAVAAAAAGDLLYSSSWDKTLKIWRAADLRCVESLAAHDDAVNAVAVAPDGRSSRGRPTGASESGRAGSGGTRWWRRWSGTRRP
uniref:Uncharacterized protein n=1 Tax=Ananas comosus var. bracteatus TaxID=296719 RepID=A0A6V7Q2S6_ANACO|nr:unnamed protein product [Ananas comosus var. bracteatus]